MDEVSTIGIDSSKRFAFVSGADGAGKEVLRENATMHDANTTPAARRRRA